MLTAIKDNISNPFNKAPIITTGLLTGLGLVIWEFINLKQTIIKEVKVTVINSGVFAEATLDPVSTIETIIRPSLLTLAKENFNAGLTFAEAFVTEHPIATGIALGTAGTMLLFNEKVIHLVKKAGAQLKAEHDALSQTTPPDAVIEKIIPKSDDPMVITFLNVTEAEVLNEKKSTHESYSEIPKPPENIKEEKSSPRKTS